MARALVELGAHTLVELGRFDRVRWDGLHGLSEVEQADSGVLGLFRAVDRLEDPSTTVRRVRNQRMLPAQKAVSERIRTISRTRRVRRVSPEGTPNRVLFGTDSDDVMAAEQEELGKTLSGLAGGRTGVAPLLAEAKRMCGDPAIVAALGIVSARLPQVQKYMGEALAGVIRLHGRSPNVTRSFAVASAADSAYIGALHELGRDARMQVKSLLGAAQKDLAGAGRTSVHSAAMKYLGGLSAIQSLFVGCDDGCGCDCSCKEGLKGLFAELRGYSDFSAAETLAEADLVAKAHAIGEGAPVQAAIDAGRPWSFPVVPVLIGAAGLGIAVGLWLWLFD